jgi:hypothetical protein
MPSLAKIIPHIYSFLLLGQSSLALATTAIITATLAQTGIASDQNK